MSSLLPASEHLAFAEALAELPWYLEHLHVLNGAGKNELARLLQVVRSSSASACAALGRLPTSSELGPRVAARAVLHDLLFEAISLSRRRKPERIEDPLGDLMASDCWARALELFTPDEQAFLARGSRA